MDKMSTGVEDLGEVDVRGAHGAEKECCDGQDGVIPKQMASVSARRKKSWSGGSFDANGVEGCRLFEMLSDPVHVANLDVQPLASQSGCATSNDTCEVDRDHSYHFTPANGREHAIKQDDAFEQNGRYRQDGTFTDRLEIDYSPKQVYVGNNDLEKNCSTQLAVTHRGKRASWFGLKGYRCSNASNQKGSPAHVEGLPKSPISGAGSFSDFAPTRTSGDSPFAKRFPLGVATYTSFGQTMLRVEDDLQPIAPVMRSNMGTPIITPSDTPTSCSPLNRIRSFNYGASPRNNGSPIARLQQSFRGFFHVNNSVVDYSSPIASPLPQDYNQSEHFPSPDENSTPKKLARHQSGFDMIPLEAIFAQDPEKGLPSLPVNWSGVGPTSKPSDVSGAMKTLLISVNTTFFLLPLLMNSFCLVLSATDCFSYAKQNATFFALLNILMVFLVRSQVWLRCVFWMAVKLFGYRWVPIIVKNGVTSIIQSLGALHAGCGVGAIMWLIYATEFSFRNRQLVSEAISGLLIAVLAMVVLSCLTAVLILRLQTRIDIFKRLHRCGGWACLVLVWCYIILSATNSSLTRSRVDHMTEFLRRQDLWLTAVTTVILILPWLSVRKVHCETLLSPAKNNIQLSFRGGLQAGLLTQVSLSPFSTWYSFGTISEGEESYTIISAVLEDIEFTNILVKDPPTHLWVRSLHFVGLPYLVHMYNRVVLVATGSGISVFLSFFLQSANVDLHLIWIAKNIRNSYGDELFQLVNRFPSERLTFYDSATVAMPSLSKVTVRKATEMRAEVVFVTSNPKTTMDVIHACKAQGVEAFGHTWDS